MQVFDQRGKAGARRLGTISRRSGLRQSRGLQVHRLAQRAYAQRPGQQIEGIAAKATKTSDGFRDLDVKLRKRHFPDKDVG
jgi:hypothetical protein